MQKQIILHVGTHKTGTTYLQKRVFPHLNNVYYANGDFLKEKILNLLYSNPITYDLETEKWLIHEFIDKLEQPTVLISYEGLFGFYQRSYHNNKQVTQILQTVFPDAKIIVAFRRQDEWLESLYHQTIHNGHSYHVDRFLNYSDGEFGAYQAAMAFDGIFDVRMNVHPFITNYQKMFGKENVLALPYELFKHDMNGFLDRFYAFTGIETYYPTKTKVMNRSFSLLSCHIALQVNKWMRSKKQQEAFRGFLKRELDSRLYIPPVFINQDKRSRIMAMHHEQNRQLGELIGMDLGQYGYY